MNITDVQTEAPSAGDINVDRLYLMMKRQYELEEKYRPMEAEKGHYPGFFDPSNDYPVDLSNEHAQLMIKDAMERVIEEMMEAANTLKNKPWKNTHVETDVLHFFEELADAQHFWMRLWLMVCGGPAEATEAMYRLYFKKSEVNRFRQETNY